jgi:hypothetical protein
MGAGLDLTSRNRQINGTHHRIFTDAEEQVISDHISDNSLVPSHLLTDHGSVSPMATVASRHL